MNDDYYQGASAYGRVVPLTEAVLRGMLKGMNYLALYGQSYVDENDGDQYSTVAFLGNNKDGHVFKLGNEIFDKGEIYLYNGVFSTGGGADPIFLITNPIKIKPALKTAYLMYEPLVINEAVRSAPRPNRATSVRSTTSDKKAIKFILKVADGLGYSGLPENPDMIGALTGLTYAILNEMLNHVIGSNVYRETPLHIFRRNGMDIQLPVLITEKSVAFRPMMGWLRAQNKGVKIDDAGAVANALIKFFRDRIHMLDIPAKKAEFTAEYEQFAKVLTDSLENLVASTLTKKKYGLAKNTTGKTMNNHYCKTGDDCVSGCCNEVCLEQSGCVFRRMLNGPEIRPEYPGILDEDDCEISNVVGQELPSKILTRNDDNKLVLSRKAIQDAIIPFLQDSIDFLDDYPASYVYFPWLYTHRIDRLVNPVLQRVVKYGSTFARILRGLDRVVMGMPALTEDIYVFRGESIPMNYEIGKTYTLPAYTSTTWSLRALMDFGTHTMYNDPDEYYNNMIIRVPKGMRGVLSMETFTNARAEFEILLRRGIRVRVLGKMVLKTPNKQFKNMVYCEVIGATKPPKLYDPQLDARFLQRVKALSAALKRDVSKDKSVEYHAYGYSGSVGSEPLFTFKGFPLEDLKQSEMFNLLDQDKQFMFFYMLYMVNGLKMYRTDKTFKETFSIQSPIRGMYFGDALGSTFEFMREDAIERAIKTHPDMFIDKGKYTGDWLKMAGTFPDVLKNVPWKLEPFQVTDDSEMGIDIIQALNEKKFYSPNAVITQHLRWLKTKPVDVGATTKKSLMFLYKNQRDSKRLWKLPSTPPSNGGLMRIAPLASYAYLMPYADVYRLGALECAITHTDRVAKDACGVFLVSLVWTMRRKKSFYPGILKLARTQEVKDCIKRAFAGECPRADGGYPRDVWNPEGHIGSVILTLQMAFWAYRQYPQEYATLFAKSKDEMRAKVMAAHHIIRHIITRGGDTDTNGAVAGALINTLTDDALIHPYMRGMSSFVANNRPAPYNRPFRQDIKMLQMDLPKSYAQTKKILDAYASLLP